MKFITLVLCKHNENGKTFLFHAPYPFYLSKGEKVIVDTCKGEQSATVVETVSCSTDEDIYRFICAAAGAEGELRKVLYRLDPVKYEESKNV